MKSLSPIILYTVLIALSLNLHAFSKLEIFPSIKPSSELLEEFTRSDAEKSALEDLENNRLPISDQENIELSDLLKNLSRELLHGKEEVGQAKQVAKYAVYRSVEKNWEDNLENTILNQFGAQSFEQFSPYFKDQINKEAHFYGMYNKVENKEYYLFYIANIAHVIVRKDLKSARVFMEFDTKTNKNRVIDENFNL